MDQWDEYIKPQLERYGGGPESELWPILNALVELNDDLNHDRLLLDSLTCIQEALDTFKKEVVSVTGLRIYECRP